MTNAKEPVDGVEPHPVPSRGLDAAARSEVIEELSAHLSEVESGASPLRPLGHVFRDAETEKKVVKHCRYVVGLVARRRRSESEVITKLADREEDPEVIDEVVARLYRGDVLDDAAFAHEWVAQRRERKLLGTAALRGELEAKGVDEATINAVLDAEAANDDGERERCEALVRERLAREIRTARSDQLDRAAMTRRIGGAVCRRGYSRNLALFVINRELDAAGVTWS